jgi:NADH-quinone oxidoreductase subunit J
MKLAGTIAGGCFLVSTSNVVFNAQTVSKEIGGKNVMLSEGSIGLIGNLGKVLFNDYVVPFEISSVLFLSAMVGAIVIGKKISLPLKGSME